MHILIFRPRADGERSAAALAARGQDVVAAPLFDIMRLPAPAPEGLFDAVVLTSGNAVPALSEVPQNWRDLPVFAVGARTAGKVRAAGFADARSADGDRNDLVELVGRNLEPGANLLLIARRDRRDDVAGRLEAAGFTVTLWIAYAAEAVAALPDSAATALRDGQADGALHYSPRGATVFLDLAKKAGLTDEALALTHVALSVDVAAPLIAAGASTVLVAEHPEEAALFAALGQVSAHHRSEAGAARASATQEDTASAGRAANMKTTGAGGARSRRTPPTIQLVAEEQTPAPDTPPEAVLPTEALSQEYAGGTPGRTKPGEGEAGQDRSAAIAAALPPPARPRLHWPALMLTGLLGGVVGAGLVLLAFSRSGSDQSEAEIALLKTRLDSLQTTAAALPNRAALQAVEAKVAAAADSAAKASADARTATARVGEIAAAPAAAGDSSAIAGLNARLGSVEALAKTASQPSQQPYAAARIVLAERVQQALASGQPFTSDVAALAKRGGSAEQLAPLNAVAASGAKTRDQLLIGLREHRAMFEREVLPPQAGWQDRLLGLANRLVTIRAVGDSKMNDPKTLPARLDATLTRGDIVAAAALWAQLPEPARRESAAFGAALQTRAAADVAIAQIARDAVAALGTAG